MNSKQPTIVRVTHRYDAPDLRVFDAWLDPEMIGQFSFGPQLRDEQVIHLKIDARVGGRFSFLVRRQGQEFDHVGEYLELDRPRRLAFTWGIVGQSENESKVIIEIKADGTGCELTLTQEMDPKWEPYADRTKQGWTKMLAALASALDDR